ncbi:hypothetical protein DKX38_003796 [Salix brachista]|uniref:Peptidase S54 rhomboid domain-containing protein n=1 Tax=Salix brachista TaxID=2182728 RepID=A0A5N5N9G8_9ROSI|nr:hypothetical protein DKX38_003796 [Salix brachista]
MMGSSLSAPPRPLWWVPIQPLNLITTAASLRLGFLVHSSFKLYKCCEITGFLGRNKNIAVEHFGYSLVCELNISHLYHVPRLKDVWHEKASRLQGNDFLQFSNDVVASTCSSCMCFFHGGGTRQGSGNEGSPNMETSGRSSVNGRQWTNILLAINILQVLVFFAQVATRGKLLFWGAKVNSLIDKGQFWRLATSSVLHANIGHLMVNCYSLNSIGPTIENLSGPRRFIAVYLTSAIASSAMSYWFCRAPAVGASGAIFGLVGSLAVFVIRHRRMIGGGKEDLQNIAKVIFLNMMIGLLTKGIDNWGHLGGLLGGVATSWFVGPAWQYGPKLHDGRRVFTDKAPIRYLTNRKTEPKNIS